MNVAFLRLPAILISASLLVLYISFGVQGEVIDKVSFGILAGVLLGGMLTGFEILFKKLKLRLLNIALFGLFLGYLIGHAFILAFDIALKICFASIAISPQSLEMTRMLILLFSIYAGTVITIRFADTIAFSIPFFKFISISNKKKEILLNISALSDTRIIDLAASGLLDGQVVLPTFTMKDLSNQLEEQEEGIRVKAKRALETIKKLKTMANLELRYNDTDFPEIKNSLTKEIYLARLINANILTSALNSTEMPVEEGIRFINIQDLSKALRPLMQTGEYIRIKIQRYGKEARQGIGYLDDGAMIVVNGGGDFLGETIEAQVLSVKHTTSGRMIFCNALSEISCAVNKELS